MHFIFDLIRKIIRGKRFGEPVVLWGDGYQMRELVYVDDFVQLMLRLNETSENELINIGAGEEFTIRRFAESICASVGYDPELIQYDESKYVGAKSKCLNVAKLKRLVPDFVPTPLDEGLYRTIKWFEEAKAY
jgi:GDP-L-fucose synthase